MATYPIVLAHGIARFDFLREHFVRRLGLDDDSLTDRLHYFRNIQSHLAREGFDVHHATVGFARDVGGRAAYLQLSGKLRALLNPLASVRGLFDDRREYENQIKGTYLNIARDLESRFPV